MSNPVELQTQPASEAVAANAEAPAGDAQMEIDAKSPEIRKEALFLGGISDLPQREIEKFVAEYVAHEYSIEWIDDSSLKLVFDNPELAADALKLLADDGDKQYDDLELRSSNPHPSKECNFQLRYATTGDQKATNAKQISRYYLLHGEPSHRFNRVRFGTDRSAPMKYGRKDLIDRKNYKSKGEDLFPHLSKNNEDDLFPHLKGKSDDLFPHLVKGGGIKKNRNRNRRNRRKGGDEMEIEPDEPKQESVYSNMDY